MSPEAADSRPGTVLLVEDEPVIALLETHQLEAAGYRVIPAVSGEQAIAQIRRASPHIDIILMDVDLGDGMDGTEAAREILAIREVPIVFVSSHTEREVVERTEGITSYGYVVKSSGEVVLLASLRTALRLFRTTHALRGTDHELFLNSVLESVQDGISVLNPDLTIRHVNSVMKRWYPHETQFVGRRCHAVYHGRSDVCSNCPTVRTLESGETEHDIVPGHPDSPIAWIELFSYPIKDPATGDVTGIVEFVRDISARVESEEALKRSLREKEILAAELQHRVKNNLAVIASLLSLELPKTTDENARRILIDAQTRVETMAMIYDEINRTDDGGTVDLRRYLQDLSTTILRTYHVHPGEVRLETDLDEAQTDSRRAVAIGLIVNELITNAVKYAFPDNGAGTIRVRLDRGAAETVVEISDDGAGLPATFRLEEATTTGFGLIRELAEQIDGAVRLHSDGGTRITLTLKSSDDARREEGRALEV